MLNVLYCFKAKYYTSMLCVYSTAQFVIVQKCKKCMYVVFTFCKSSVVYAMYCMQEAISAVCTICHWTYYLRSIKYVMVAENIWPGPETPPVKCQNKTHVLYIQYVQRTIILPSWETGGFGSPCSTSNRYIIQGLKKGTGGVDKGKGQCILHPRGRGGGRVWILFCAVPIQSMCMCTACPSPLHSRHSQWSQYNQGSYWLKKNWLQLAKTKS